MGKVSEAMMDIEEVLGEDVFANMSVEVFQTLADIGIAKHAGFMAQGIPHNEASALVRLWFKGQVIK
jgi:hypothetical protein